MKWIWSKRKGTVEKTPMDHETKPRTMDIVSQKVLVKLEMNFKYPSQYAGKEINVVEAVRAIKGTFECSPGIEIDSVFIKEIEIV